MQDLSTSALLIFGLDNSVIQRIVGALLCMVECLGTSLAPSHYMSVAYHPRHLHTHTQAVNIKNVSIHCQMSPEGQNGPWLKAICLLGLGRVRPPGNSNASCI